MYLQGTAVTLATIAERMAQVVDPEMRARLTGEYLALLQEYHGGRPRADFDARAQAALARASAGRTAYKLTPALGTTNDRFFGAYRDAAAALSRLDALADRVTDPAQRLRWEAFMRDIGQRLTQLYNDAEISTTNANLSRLDALANETLNMLAARLMPAEVQLRRALGVPVLRYVPRGASGAVARAALPATFAPGYGRRAATADEQRHPYSRSRMARQPGGGRVTRWAPRSPALAGDYDTFKAMVTGTWDAAATGAAAAAGAAEGAFRDAVTRLVGVRTRLEKLATAVKTAQAADTPADAQADALAELLRRWDSSRAELDALAAQLRSYSYDSLDSAGTAVRTALGQDETQPSTVPATWVLFRPQIDAARENVLALERDAATAGAGLPAAGGGYGILALSAGLAVLRYLARRG